jgi:20S proteasome subunit alpha 7
MSGTGYDLSTSTYSQDGRIFQIEYAHKAVENAETVVALCCSDGIILACEKIQTSPLETADRNHRIFNIDKHIGIAICGRLPDGKNVVNRARKECESYKRNFGRDIPGPILADRMANYIHAHTCYLQFRPLGTAIFIATIDENQLSLFMIDNSGLLRGYRGVAHGKGRQVAKSFLEAFDEKGNVEAGLKVVARSLVAAHEEFKEKTWEMEVTVIGPQTEFKHKHLDFEERKRMKQRAEEEHEEAA